MQGLERCERRGVDIDGSRQIKDDRSVRLLQGIEDRLQLVRGAEEERSEDTEVSDARRNVVDATDFRDFGDVRDQDEGCLLYTSPSPRDS